MRFHFTENGKVSTQENNALILLFYCLFIFSVHRIDDISAEVK